MNLPTNTPLVLLCLALPLALVACSDDDDAPATEPPADDGARPFELRFVPLADGSPVGCGDTIANLGIDGRSTAEVADLRFYVSDLELLDAEGEPIAHVLDENEFQYRDANGAVTLVDLTADELGACTGEGLDFVEGTARTHTAITGTADTDDIVGARFTVGLPQALMRSVIAENTLEGAPSPMGEMYWSWASGYRHFVMNFLTADGDGGEGTGFLHIGSVGCTAVDGENALATLEECALVNNPQVALTGFSEDTTIGVELSALLAGVDFVETVLDENREPVLDENGATLLESGMACHSAVAMQPDCGPVFDNFGLNPDDGSGDAAANRVFVVR